MLGDHVFSTEELVRVRTSDLEKNKNWIDKITRSIGEELLCVMDWLESYSLIQRRSQCLALMSGGWLDEVSLIFFHFHQVKLSLGRRFLKEINSIGKGSWQLQKMDVFFL
jgi:hypothetical protein